MQRLISVREVVRKEEAMILWFKELIDYREMLFSLVRKELRSRYKASVLGFLWTFLNPLLQIAVYSVVFRVIMKVNIERYYFYMFAGLVPWMFFTTSVQGSSTCLINHANLVNKIYFPRLILPMVTVTGGLVNMLYTMLVVFAIALIGGVGLSVYLIYLPLVMALEYVFCMGIAFFVSAVTVYLRDMEHIISILLMAGFYLVPVVYSRDMIPQDMRYIYDMNPMAGMICAFQDILYYKKMPTLHHWAAILAASLATAAVGAWVFQVMQKRFAEEL